MSDCELICFVPIPLNEANILFSNAEIETTIAAFDPAVVDPANDGYPEGALAVFSPSIAVSLENENRTYLGADTASAKWVHNKSIKEVNYLVGWSYYPTYSIGDAVRGSYDYTARQYHTYVSAIASNKNNALPSGGASNASWTYDGLKDYRQYTRTDLSGAFLIGENYWSAAQIKGFTAIVDITSDASKAANEAINAVPVVTDSGIEALESKWKVIDVINPVRFLEPSVTQKTYRDGSLIMEFKLDRRAKHFGFFGLEGDDLEVTIWDSTDTQVFNQSYELIKEALDYEEWAYDPVVQETQVFIEDIPWDYEIRVKMEITGAVCAIGLPYPCNDLTFGQLDYSPQKTFIDPTEETQSDYSSEIGVVKEYPIETLTSFTTFADPADHDIIESNIKTAKVVSNESGLPLLFKGTNKFEAYRYILGRSPKITQTIVNSGRTQIKMDLEGVIK